MIYYNYRPDPEGRRAGGRRAGGLARGGPATVEACRGGWSSTIEIQESLQHIVDL